MANFDSIPSEILLNTIELAGLLAGVDREQTLCAACLVCRSWYPLAQRVLVHTVVLMGPALEQKAIGLRISPAMEERYAVKELHLGALPEVIYRGSDWTLMTRRALWELVAVCAPQLTSLTPDSPINGGIQDWGILGMPGLCNLKVLSLPNPGLFPTMKILFKLPFHLAKLHLHHAHNLLSVPFLLALFGSSALSLTHLTFSFSFGLPQRELDVLTATIAHVLRIVAGRLRVLQIAHLPLSYFLGILPTLKSLKYLSLIMRLEHTKTLPYTLRVLPPSLKSLAFTLTLSDGSPDLSRIAGEIVVSRIVPPHEGLVLLEKLRRISFMNIAAHQVPANSTLREACATRGIELTFSP